MDFTKRARRGPMPPQWIWCKAIYNKLLNRFCRVTAKMDFTIFPLMK